MKRRRVQDQVQVTGVRKGDVKEIVGYASCSVYHVQFIRSNTTSHQVCSNLLCYV